MRQAEIAAAPLAVHRNQLALLATFLRALVSVGLALTRLLLAPGDDVVVDGLVKGLPGLEGNLRLTERAPRHLAAAESRRPAAVGGIVSVISTENSSAAVADKR
mmetsp:Transcript_19058/g.56702  ORF Transcript_19058/g.56702 Transcript_19058/m.56702 type:complete len:104 (+) Transcript_19058:675-986(+)